MLAPGKWILYSVQEIMKGQSGSLPGMSLGYRNFRKVIFRNYADHAEKVSGKVVPWLSEDYHYDLLLGLAVPTNFQCLYNSGVGLKNLRKFLRYCLLVFFSTNIERRCVQGKLTMLGWGAVRFVHMFSKVTLPFFEWIAPCTISRYNTTPVTKKFKKHFPTKKGHLTPGRKGGTRLQEYSSYSLTRATSSA